MNGPGRFGLLATVQPQTVAEGFAIAGEVMLSGVLLASATAALGLVVVGLRSPGVWARGRAGIVRWTAQPWRDGDAVAVLGFALAMLAGPILNAWGGALGRPDSPPTAAGVLVGMGALPVLSLGLCLRRAGLAGLPLAQAVLGPEGGRFWRRDCRWGLAGGLALVLPSLVLSWGAGHLLLRWGIEPRTQDALRWFGDPATAPSVRWLMALQAVVLAPAIEELFYRGVVFCVLLRARPSARSVVLLAFFFAVLHLHPQLVAPLFVVGLGFSVGLLLSGSLLLPLVMHMTFNAANLMLFMASRALS